MAVVDVGVVITARDQATATINRVQGALGRLNGRGGLGGTSQGFAVGGVNAFRFASRLNTLAASAFVVYQSIRSVVLGLAQFAAESQRVTQSLIVTTGSFAAAQRQFTQMVREFTPAGFQIDNMVQAFNQLRGAGLGIQDANRTLRATASAIAAFGGTQEQMDRAALALSQIGAKGVAAMEELRGQLSEAVPIALAVMADQAGTSIRELTDRVRRGLVSSEEAIRLFTEGAEELFGDLLEAQRSTLTGSVNELTNSITVGLSDLFARTDLDERLTFMIQDATRAILDFFASIDQDTIDNFFAGVARLAEVFDALGTAVSAVRPLIEGLGPTINPVISFILDLINVVLRLVGIITGVAIGAVLRLAQAFAFLARDVRSAQEIGALAEQAERAARAGAAAALRVGQDRPESNLSIAQQLAVLRGRQQLESASQRLLRLQERQAEYNRNAASATREQLRIQERLRDLVAETNAQYQGSLLSFADALDRVANRVADIFDLENFTYDVRQASADALRGMTSEQVRQAELQRGLAQGLGSQLAQIRANAVATFTNAAERFRLEMQDSLDQIRLAQAEAFGELTGGRVEAAILRTTIEYRRQARAIQEELEAATQLHARTGQEAETIAEIQRLLARNNQLREQALAYAEATARAAEVEAQARMRVETSQIRLEALQAARGASDNPLVQLGLGSSAGQLIQRVEQERQRLFTAITEMETRLNSLRASLPFANAEDAALISDQINAITQSINVQSDAMARLSENAILSRELWQQVGDTIQNSVGDAIYGLITGTQSLREVGVQMFQALTRAAIDYIVQLLIIRALKAASGLPFQSGGVVGGPVTALAAGGAITEGIIRGPTTFLAGEAGKEAILPLTQVNGKLGVRAAGGGGGDHYNIHIHAMDTQTGAEFIMRNADSVVAALRRKNNLNQGVLRSMP